MEALPLDTPQLINQLSRDFIADAEPEVQRGNRQVLVRNCALIQLDSGLLLLQLLLLTAEQT